MTRKVSSVGFAAVMVSVCLLGLSSVAQADIGDDFEDGDSGWIAEEISNELGTGFNPAGVTWSPTGGDPGGCISRSDYGGGTRYAFSAPAKYLGDKSAYLGSALSWDMRNSVGDYDGGDKTNHLTMTGNGITLVHWGTYPRGGGWTHIKVPFVYSQDWTQIRNGDWRAPVSEAEFALVFDALQGLYLHSDWGWGPDTGYLDNVEMAVPEPATLGLLGLGGLAMIRRRQAP